MAESRDHCPEVPGPDHAIECLIFWSIKCGLVLLLTSFCHAFFTKEKCCISIRILKNKLFAVLTVLL